MDKHLKKTQQKLSEGLRVKITGQLALAHRRCASRQMPDTGLYGLVIGWIYTVFNAMCASKALHRGSVALSTALSNLG
jgi:hypothetical protein